MFLNQIKNIGKICHLYYGKIFKYSKDHQNNDLQCYNIFVLQNCQSSFNICKTLTYLYSFSFINNIFPEHITTKMFDY